jgi:putative hydrolase of the HAD superfamily
VTQPAICFDATGTLIELKGNVGEVYRRIAIEHGVDLPAWRLDDAFRRILRRAPTRGIDGDTIARHRQHEVDWWFERIRETFQATDSTARFDDFPAFAQALFDAYGTGDLWRVRAGASGMLGRLRDRGWRLVIVSNFDHRLLKILEQLDISRFFELVMIPVESGVAKPDRAVFKAASKALETPLRQLLYVGDDAKEVLEAIAQLGLQVFDIREIEDLETFPDLVSSTATLPHADRTVPVREDAQGRPHSK